MKKKISPKVVFKTLFVCLLAFHASLMKAQSPKWVEQRPISSKAYIGIGMAKTSDADYIQKAAQKALADIASQISTKVENESFLHTVDVDGNSRQLFEETIINNMSAWIEGAEIKDSYKSADTYYVYYTLDKKLYAKNAEKQRTSVLTKAADYLVKGRAAEDNVNLTQALHLYGKGMDVVEPWVFMNLITTIDGQEVDVPAALFDAYINVFSGLAITTNEVNITGEIFKPVAKPIAACLSRNDVVIPNVKLKATFVTGSGAISPAIETDYNGTAEFYVTNITSKQQVQEIRIAIDDSFMEGLPKAYRKLLQTQTWPSAKVVLTLAAQPKTAYLYLNEQNDLEGIERYLGKIVSNDHFTLIEDPDAADCFIDLSSKIDMGEVVKGKYDLNTCYCTVVMKVYNNKTQALLLDYSEEQVKVLVPTNKTAEETMKMCINEVMKRVKRNFPKQLEKLNTMF